MEMILFQPPRIGLKVYYNAQKSDIANSGVYAVASTDDYNMVGFVLIEGQDGQCYGVNAEQLDILENHSDFLELSKSVKADGVTFLPSEAKLRSFGFTDHREGYWYYTDRVGSAESFNLTIPKKPVGEVLGEPVYSYTEGVIDEYFGQHAYFGGMKDEFRFDLAERLSSVLKALLELGLLIKVDPIEYNWKEWPEDHPLRGTSSDGITLAALRRDSSEYAAKQPSAEHEVGHSEARGSVSTAQNTPVESTLDPEILAQVAAAIDREVQNFSWDSLAHGMTMGEYVAPTAIRTYLQSITPEKG